jgi:hypothetical protein
MLRARRRARHPQARAALKRPFQSASQADDLARSTHYAKEVERPIFTMILPERKDRAKAIAAPLCLRCRALSPMQRLGRSMRLLKKMWSRDGKQTHFTFKPRQR